MIAYIIRRFIRDAGKTTDPHVREQYSTLSGILGMVCNLLLFAAKGSVGMLTGSAAILSDAFNNLTDMGSSFISIISARLSSRPPDREHPFGHGRFEYLAALTIALIILVVGFKLCEESAAKLFHPEPPAFSLWVVVILVLSIAVKLWMYQYNRYIAKKISSGVQEAAAADSLSDAMATAGVLIASAAQQITDLPVDAAAGLAIGLFIMYTGCTMARRVVHILLGKAPSPELVADIVRCAMQNEYVVGVHAIRIHDYGPGRMFGSLHAEVPDTVSLTDAHAALDVLEDELQEKFQMNMNIHMDPLCTDMEKINAVRHRLDRIIQETCPSCHTAGLRMTSGKARLNIICDLHIPPAAYTGKNLPVIRRRIEKAMQQYDIRCRVVFARILPESTAADAEEKAGTERLREKAEHLRHTHTP